MQNKTKTNTELLRTMGRKFNNTPTAKEPPP